MGKAKDQLMKADDAHSRISCGFQSPVPWAAAFATLMFALSPLVWFYSVQAEVFAVNNMFVGVLVAGAVLVRDRTLTSVYFCNIWSVLGTPQRLNRHDGRILSRPGLHQPAHSSLLRLPPVRMGSLQQALPPRPRHLPQALRPRPPRPLPLRLPPHCVHQGRATGRMG